MDVDGLLDAVAGALLTVDMPTREYILLQTLADHPSLQELGGHPMLVLFRKHFLLMHCLYKLQDRWLEDEKLLSISPLEISITSFSETDQHRLRSHDLGVEKVKSFYLDWQQFERTTEQNVDDWISSFWTRFESGGQQTESAYKVLGVDPATAWTHVVKAYRNLASTHHPDRGGNAQDFARVQAAYETLKSYLGKSH